MQFLRKPFLVLAAAFLPALLLLTAFTTGSLKIIGSPEPVKQVLAESGIYSSVISETLQDRQRSSGNSSSVSLTDPLVKKAAESSFTTQLIQNSTEQAINGTYKWLEGEVPLPDFRIDLSNAKFTFAQKVGDAAAKRVESLPKCAIDIQPASFDPFSAKCLPSGTTPAQVGAQAENDILRGGGFLEDPVITANTLKEDDTQKSIFAEQLKDAPEQYQQFKKLPALLIALTLLTVLIIIMLSISKLSGLKRVGWTLLIVGLVVFVSAWLFNHIISREVAPDINLDNKVLQNNVKELVTDTSRRASESYWTIGGIYIALGALSLGGVMLLEKRGSGKKNFNASNVSTKTTPRSTPTPARKTPTKTKKPKKKPIKIQ